MTLAPSRAPSDPAPNYGEVFTRRWVADVLLDLTGYTADCDLAELRLVEPSCGSGAFLGPAVERLLQSAGDHGRRFEELGSAVRAYDVQPGHVQAAGDLCHSLLIAAGAEESRATDLVNEWIHQGDFLIPEGEALTADVVVGNPPYVRYDDLLSKDAVAYRETWATMRGRGDIYVGFIERALRILNPEGRAGFICADRWMRNQYGAQLREFVAADHAVEHVWTMHDVQAFESDVSAYPAITVLANHPQRSAVVADTTRAFGEDSARQLASWSTGHTGEEFQAAGVKAYRLATWFAGGELWPTGSPRRLAMIEYLSNHFAPLHDPRGTGTRVSIGIASGADKVYVTKDPAAAESDRMLPLAMRRDLMSGTFNWQGNYLVNPWNADGSLVSLEDYPKLHAYLSQHPALRERFIARKNPDMWYRTIDKVHSPLVGQPKLLLQDMKTTIHPVLERGGHYPHHNLYYVVSEKWDLEVLGGLLLSRIAQAFIEAYCVRMRGGTLRFQAQYLKKIRVPEPDSIDAATADELRSAFRSRDAHAATGAAAIAYGIDIEEYELD